MVIIAGNDTFISTDIVASFLIKQVDVDGTMKWKIVAWRDDIGQVLSFHTPGVSQKSGASVEGNTWGRVKAMFGQ